MALYLDLRILVSKHYLVFDCKEKMCEFIQKSKVVLLHQRIAPAEQLLTIFESFRIRGIL